MRHIVVATVKEWNIKNYFRLIDKYAEEYTFHLLTEPEELSYSVLEKIDPEYVFFPHWSWIIPKEIYTKFECVVFHMTDLPFGRGGSPMQNLIMREIYDSKISAIRVDEGLDTGAIYLKEDFSITVGSAEENFIKLSSIIFEKMIPRFLKEKLSPWPQTGEVTSFLRRAPSQSNIAQCGAASLAKLYDFIRMLDAEGYPKAYLEMGNLKIEFLEVHMRSNKLVGRFEVTENE